MLTCSVKLTPVLRGDGNREYLRKIPLDPRRTVQQPSGCPYVGASMYW